MATTATKTKDLTITRTFDAPREVGWKMWTDPERILSYSLFQNLKQLGYQ